MTRIINKESSSTLPTKKTKFIPTLHSTSKQILITETIPHFDYDDEQVQGIETVEATFTTLQKKPKCN